MTKQFQGTIWVALSGMLYGMIGLLGIKLFQQNFTVSAMLFWRFLIASAWIALVLLFSKTVIKLKFNEIKAITIAALFYALGSALFFIATKQIGTGPGMVIFFSFPVFVAIFSKKYDRATLVTLTLLLTGLLLLKTQGIVGLNWHGIQTALIAAFAYGFYIFYSQRHVNNIDSRVLSFIICLLNTIIFLLLAKDSLIFPHTQTAWLYLLMIGIVATAMPIQLMLLGLKYITPFKASILSILEPIVTLLLGTIFLNETLSPLQWCGILILMGSGTFLTLPTLRVE